MTAMAMLQDRLDEFKRNIESGAPPYNMSHEALEKMHRATAELKASGIESRALKVGDGAPEFRLFNQDHVEVASGRFPTFLPDGGLTFLIMGWGMKLFSFTTPITAGASAAGICGSLIFEIWCVPFTSRL